MRRLLSSLFLCLAMPVSAQEFTTYKGHGGPIFGLVVTDDDTLASASFDNSVGVWDGRVPRWLEGHDAAVTAIAQDMDGALVTGGDDFAVWHWGDSPRMIGRHRGKVTSLAASPDGSVIAAGSWDGTIVLWPLGQGSAETLPFAGAGVNAVAYAPDGAALFAATSRGEVLRYDMGLRGKPRPLARHSFGINRLLVGDAWIAYGAVDGRTRVIDATSGAQIADFTLDRRPILAMDYHAATRRLAIGDGQGHIMMIDTTAWRITRDFRAMRRGPVWALAFSKDGRVIHAGGIDDVIYAWPVALLDTYDPAGGDTRESRRDPATMSNGEQQFMRRCSICHSLEAGPSRKAGPTLHGVFGRRAGVVPGYRYSPTLDGSAIVWNDATIDALFDVGPDHYIPGTKMPMQVIANSADRADLVAFLRTATNKE